MKPDRFERAIRKLAFGNDQVSLKPDHGYTVGALDALDLLCQEHAWVQRMVRREQRELKALAKKTARSTDPRDQVIADGLLSRIVQCQDILYKLEQRRK